MLLAILGSTMAALLGLAILKPRRLASLADWAYLQLKYNAVAAKGIFLDRLQAKYNKTELPKMPGRLAIVTGGSRGIGLEVVKMLLRCDMDVIMACRTVEKGEKAVAAIRDSGIKTGKLRVMELDNASLESVRRFVEEFNRSYSKLDILINNAGVMFTPYEETKDGFEQQYGVNYLSHFLLTLLLIPALKKGGTSEYHSRIVNVSSCAHLLGSINFDDINHKGYFLTGAAYAQSKLAQLMFTKSLARLFEKKKLPIQANAVHPGVVNTDLFDHCYLKYMKLIGRLFFKNMTEGATPIVFAAVSPRIEKKSSLYISNCLEESVNPLANIESIQDRLFDVTLKQVDLQNFGA